MLKKDKHLRPGLHLSAFPKPIAFDLGVALAGVGLASVALAVGVGSGGAPAQPANMHSSTKNHRMALP